MQTETMPRGRTGLAATMMLAIAAALAIGICTGSPSLGQSSLSPAPLSNEETQTLVKSVLQTELSAAEDVTHPMQYQLRKESPRVSTTKLIVETGDGDVARLISINDHPLNTPEKQNEDARLQILLNDPGQQRHRQQRERADTERAHKVMRALPDAFLYSFAGIAETPQGPSYRLSFQPNPSFDPQDLEAQVLKGMAGEMWIDVAQRRVTRLEGKRIREVDYGWGILGKLDQGGTLLLEQGDTGNHQWRTTHMVLIMTARFLFKSVKLDTSLELSHFEPVAKMSYQQAVQMLQARDPSMLVPSESNAASKR